jgi:hypothetical protein
MSFPASYSGECGGCREHFGPGTEIAYVEGVLVVDECCGTTDPILARTATAIDPVLPRGRKVSDRCGDCFQVPASNGVCGCS